MKASDRNAVISTHKESIYGICKSHYSRKQMDAWTSRLTSELFDAGLHDENNLGVVAIDSAKVIGYGFFNAIDREVRAVYVLPANINRGAGRLILDKLEELAREKGIENLSLQSTLNAVGFYKKQGYREIGTEKHCIDDSVSLACVRLEKNLIQDENKILYRPMRDGEAVEVFNLVKAGFDEYVRPDMTEEGAKEFFRAAHQMIYDRSAEHVILVAQSTAGLVGMIDVRAHNHICLFFTAKAHQRKGVGRRLLELAIKECFSRSPEGSNIDVHSSPYAVPIYEKLGFVAFKPEQLVNGIRFVPMSRPLNKLAQGESEMNEYPSWQYDEMKQIGKDYGNLDEVEAYDARHAKFRDIEKENAGILERLGVQPEHVLIEFGSGTGAFAVAAAVKCARVYAVDISAAMLEYAEKRAKAADIANIVFCHGGFLTYSHAALPVDAIITNTAFHHLPDFWKGMALQRMGRMLKAGGQLSLSDIIFEQHNVHENIERMIATLEKKGGPATRKDMEAHVQNEFSTYDWIMDGLLTRAGFEITSKVVLQGVVGRYLCRKRAE